MRGGGEGLSEMSSTCLGPFPSPHPHTLTRFEEMGEEQVVFKMISENGSKVRRPD